MPRHLEDRLLLLPSNTVEDNMVREDTAVVVDMPLQPVLPHNKVIIIVELDIIPLRRLNRDSRLLMDLLQVC